MSNEVLDELLAILAHEEDRVLASTPYERRHCLIDLTRAIDHLYVLGTFLQDQPSEDLEETLHLCVHGWATALNLFIDNTCKNPGIPFIKSTPAMEKWADSALQHCGRLGYCRQIISLHRAGLFDLMKTGPEKYQFRSTSGQIGIERTEAQNFHWLTDFVASQDSDSWNRLASSKLEIHSKMSSLVRKWKKHFIAYDADPGVDAYFEEAGVLKSHLMHGQDAFPGEVTFGGVPFYAYRAAVATLVGFTLKHYNFCLSLMNKHAELHPRNLLTMFVSLRDFADSLAGALEIDQTAAEHLLTTLTLTPQNKEVHCLVPGGPPAPLIEIGADRALHSIYGSLNRPFYFLLNELKSRYRADWDKAVNQRERVFRTELFQLFPQQHIIKIDRRVEIKKKNGEVLTDIDAILFDKKTGIAGLFQLKWQDAFGNSMRQRESSKTNLLQTANKWVERVSYFISENDLSVASTRLGLATHGQDLKEFRIFVIGRNAAHFSGEGLPNSCAAWGMWPQVLRLASDRYDRSDPLGGLFAALKDDCPLAKPPPKLETNVIKIGSRVIQIEPPAVPTPNGEW